jgi:hypothetical protein
MKLTPAVSTPFRFERLPEQVQNEILTFLGPVDLAFACVVSKAFKGLTERAAARVLQILRRDGFLSQEMWLSVKKGMQNGVSFKRSLFNLTRQRILAIGGAFGSDAVSELNPCSRCLKELSGTTVAPREYSNAVISRGNLFLFGGEEEDSTRSVEMYDPVQDKWECKQALQTSFDLRHTAAVVTPSGRVFVTGGQDPHRRGNPTSSVYSVEDLNAEGANWEKCHEMELLEARYGHAVAVLGNTLFVAGGCGEASVLDSVEAISLSPNTAEAELGLEMDPSATLTRSHSQMVNARHNFKLLVVNGELYAVGGDDKATIEVFCAATKKWAIVATFPSFRKNFSASVCNGSIYLFGGQNRRRMNLATWEVFCTQLKAFRDTDAKRPDFTPSKARGLLYTGGNSDCTRQKRCTSDAVQTVPHAGIGFVFGQTVVYPAVQVTW